MHVFVYIQDIYIDVYIVHKTYFPVSVYRKDLEAMKHR